VQMAAFEGRVVHRPSRKDTSPTNGSRLALAPELPQLQPRPRSQPPEDRRGYSGLPPISRALCKCSPDPRVEAHRRRHRARAAREPAQGWLILSRALAQPIKRAAQDGLRAHQAPATLAASAAVAVSYLFSEEWRALMQGQVVKSTIFSRLSKEGQGGHMTG
jgi:hypothetical protein